MEPLVSILIPAFNSERWVGEAIESALSQTWKAKEIVIVDDGSTDQTLSVARKFASTSVSVVTQPNEGAASARNKAYSLSQGDYIQWLDADDLLAPDKISKQMKAVADGATTRTLLSAAWGRFRNRSDRAEFRPSLLWADCRPVEWLLRKLENNVYMQTATWLVSRELTEAAGPWDTRLLSDDDGEYFCRVLLASDRVQFVEEAKTFYRSSGGGGLSHVGHSDRKLEALFLSLQLHIQYIRSLEESERVRAACLVFLQTWLVYFYPEKPAFVEQLEALAAELGGRLEPPRLSWKYAWIQKLFGWHSAKRTQLFYNECRSSVLSSWDGALSRLKI
ncbi:MAG TPA: glycosyltransferase family 2 protein [Candidatus Udaeobacter sp.]|jgi:GT2 family glycosyltransferase|nr:glycosyltransferase family 2 protein [Candidatus Udaeobacter sp.]